MAARSSGLMLSVELLQRGFVQDSGQWRLDGRKREITFGSSTRAHLSAMISDLPAKLGVFRVGDGKAQAILYPGWGGYVSTGREFGSVAEFVAPRGAIAPLASVDNPLVLELLPEARGSIRVWGFELIFKVERIKAKKAGKRLERVARLPFAMPEVDSSFERSVIGVSMLAVCGVGAGFLTWLLAAPTEQIRTVDELPERVAFELVNPAYYSTLPAVFNSPLKADFSPVDPTNHFDATQVVKLAMRWVHELQDRWSAAELGLEHRSKLGVLLAKPKLAESARVEAQWSDTVRRQHEAMVANQKSGERFFRFQKPPPRLSVDVSGGAQGSLLFRLERRLRKVRETLKSIKAMAIFEHQFLREYYKNDEGVKFRELFEAPALGKLIGARPDEEFYREAERFAVAQAYADEASSSRVRRVLDSLERTNARELERWRSEAVPIVWLGGDGTLGANVDATTENGENAWKAMEAAVVHNAMLSTGATRIPPAPRPQPKIDRNGVLQVIKERREEVRSCYNRTLRDSPNLSGQVTFRWFIDSDGRARDPRVVQADFQDQELFFCVRARIARWQFPKSRNGDFLFEHPFTFVVARN